MPRIVVAGSENDPRFALINFSNTPPTVLLKDPGFAAGCRVDIDANMVAVGSVLTGNVTVFDVTQPTAPVQGATINTALAGIGAISINGNLVAVGEYVNSFNARVKLIDFSNPNAPVVVWTATTTFVNITIPSDPSQPSAAIASIAFASATVVVASGPSAAQIAQIDFTSPGPPVVTLFAVVPGAPTIDADPNANTLAVGDNLGTKLDLLNSTTHTVTGSANTTLGGVNSIAVSGSLTLAGSANEFSVARVNFSGGVAVKLFDPQLGGGSTTAIEQTIGVCGAIQGSKVKVFDLAPATPALLATADAQIASISTIAISDFTAPHASANALTFNVVRVGGSSTLPLTITNTGTLPLTLSQLKLQNNPSRFSFTPAGPFTVAPGGTVTINVKFSPTAEVASTDALTMTTNDPAQSPFSVPLSGTGGLPHIGVSANSLNLNNVAVCQSGQGTFKITNTGALPLTVASIASAGAPFSVSPATATVVQGTPLTVTVTFTPSATGPASGTITILSNDAANPSKTVTLTGNGLPAPPPAITVNPGSLNFGATPVQFFIGLRITVANTAPCQTLNFTMTTSGAPYFVTASDPTSMAPTATSLTDTVAANSSKRYVVVFAPTATGVIPGTLTITSNDPLNATIVVPLAGSGVLENPIALELVLDRSGSMSGAAPSGTKMDALKAAVALFADIVIPGHGDAMGSVEFDDQFNVLTAFADYTTAQQSSIKSDAATLTPRHATSIGGGLQLGQTEITPSTLPRKVIVVFTDGMENTPPKIATISPGIIAAGTEIYAVGLGQPQNISTAALSMLAASANGKFFQTDDTLVLRKDFVQVLADAYRLNMAADPIFTVQKGKTVDVPVEITKCDRRITFILHWDNPNSQVGFSVVAPDGTQFTQSTPAVNRLVRFGVAAGYSFCQIAFPPIDPGSGNAIGPLQIGTWHLLVTGTSLAGASERCATNVMVDSELTISAVASAADITSPLRVSAQILDGGVPVHDADLVLRVTSPTKSLASVLTPKVVAAALNADTKPFAAGIKPLIPTRTTAHRLVFTDRGQRFAVQLPAPKVDGVYNFEIVARGKACGSIFDRYATFSQYIGRKPSTRTTKIQVTPSGPFGVVVTVTPRDAQSVPLGPGLASLIVPVVTAAMVSPVTDQGDGSYAFRLFWKGKRARPTLTVKIGDGEKSVPLPGFTAKPAPAAKKATKKNAKKKK